MSYLSKYKGTEIDERLSKAFIQGEAEPTTETEGVVGGRYFDTSTKETYICVAVEEGSYIWEKLKVDTEGFVLKDQGKENVNKILRVGVDGLLFVSEESAAVGGGISEYSSTKIYALNELCFLDGVIYKSIIDNNLGNEVTNADCWEVYGGGSGGGSDYEQIINYTMLYDSGDECSDVSGGWSSDGYSYSTMTIKSGTKNSDNFYVVGASNVMSILGTANTIDLKSYSKLFHKGYANGSYNNDVMCTFVTPSKTISDGYSTAYRWSAGEKGVAELDLSNINDNAYISVLADAQTTRSGYTYNLFLTKADDITTLCTKAGVSATSLETLLADTNSLSAIFNNEDAVEYMIYNCTGDFMAGVLNSETAVGLLAESPYLNKVVGNEHWAKFIMMLPTANGLLGYRMTYDFGNECEEVTGGWGKHDATYSTGWTITEATKNSDHILTVGASATINVARTKNLIDFTGYVKLGFVCETVGTKTTDNVSLDTQTELRLGDGRLVCIDVATTDGKELFMTDIDSTGSYYISVLTSSESSRSAKTYNVFLLRADNFQKWAEFGGITPTDLDTLLADSTAMNTLMANQSAVDYLAGCTGDLMVSILNSTVGVEAIIGSTLAVQTLTTHPVWKKFIDVIPTSINAGLNLV